MLGKMATADKLWKFVWAFMIWLVKPFMNWIDFAFGKSKWMKELENLKASFALEIKMKGEQLEGLKDKLGEEMAHVSQLLRQLDMASRTQRHLSEGMRRFWNGTGDLQPNGLSCDTGEKFWDDWSSFLEFVANVERDKNKLDVDLKRTKEELSRAILKISLLENENEVLKIAISKEENLGGISTDVEMEKGFMTKTNDEKAKEVAKATNMLIMNQNNCKNGGTKKPKKKLGKKGIKRFLACFSFK